MTDDYLCGHCSSPTCSCTDPLSARVRCVTGVAYYSETREVDKKMTQVTVTKDLYCDGREVEVSD